MKTIVTCVCTALVALALAGCGLKVAEKMVVKINYTGMQADGTIFDSTEEESKPLEIMIGGGYWIPAAEEGLIGMAVGEKRRVEVKAAGAFGEYNPALTEEVSKDKFPDDLQFRKGLEVQTYTMAGPTLARIIEVKPNSVVVDYNHPLAGRDLIFEVEVLAIRRPSRSELDAWDAARSQDVRQ